MRQRPGVEPHKNARKKHIGEHADHDEIVLHSSTSIIYCSAVIDDRKVFVGYYVYNRVRKGSFVVDVQLLFLVTSIAYAFYFMNRTLKTTTVDAPLTKREKLTVIILLLFSTIPSWLILRLGWQKKLPLKAKAVTRYMCIILGTLIGIAVLGIIVSILLVAINPSARVPQ